MEYTYTLKIPTKNGTIATVEEVQNETKYIKEDLDQIEKDINTLIDTSVTLDTPQKITSHKQFNKNIEILEKLEDSGDIYSTEYYNGGLVINPLYGDPITLKYPLQSGKVALTSDFSNYYTKAESNGKYITLNTTQLVTGPKTFNGITVFANGNVDGDKVSGSKIAINGGMAKISN